MSKEEFQRLEQRGSKFDIKSVDVWIATSNQLKAGDRVIPQLPNAGQNHTIDVPVPKDAKILAGWYSPSEMLTEQSLLYNVMVSPHSDTQLDLTLLGLTGREGRIKLTLYYCYRFQ